LKKIQPLKGIGKRRNPLDILPKPSSAVIDEAENGDEVLQKINAAPPHLIFMDIRLPGVNGLQLTQMIKKDFPNICINWVHMDLARESCPSGSQHF
jgi:CheY-like chemotaxis protein